MYLKIAQRYRPFSHTPGIVIPIPGTFFSAQIFPGRLYLNSWDGKKEEIVWKWRGPISSFTCVQDLEKGCIIVFGKGEEGYFRYRIESTEKGIIVKIEKSPIEEGDRYVEAPYFKKQSRERLFLGVTKQQDWEKIQRRSDFREIYPIFLKLASFLPYQKEEGNIFVPAIFPTLFFGMLQPRLTDEGYHNVLQDIPSIHNPFSLIRQGASAIRKHFFRQEGDTLYLLSHLPKGIISGRYISLAFSLGEIDIEWSKKILRRVIFRINHRGTIGLSLQKEIVDFRITLDGKSHKHLAVDPLDLREGTYFLDRFQK